MRKISVVITLLFVLLAGIYADATETVSEESPIKKAYKLSVNNADEMNVNDNVIVIAGNIDVSFETTEGSSSESYTLTCEKAAIDTDNKTLAAIGNVLLTKKNDSKGFKGSVLVLNWENLDIKVFDGVSSSERNKSSSNPVTFYANGDSISYAGKEGTVYFEDGTIATSDIKDPYWSIKAKQLGLMGNDIFVENAVLKLGRVPVFWIPVFFYPGTKLSFNPAIGMSSTKGAFINTTTEVYGVYTDSTSGTSEATTTEGAVATGMLDLLKTDDNAEYVRNGFMYEKVGSRSDLSKTEQWARKTGSYMAIMADAYFSGSDKSVNGIAAGIDTSNKLSDGKITIKAKAVAAYAPNNLYATDSLYSKFRFGGTFSSSFKIGKNTNLSLDLPYYTDPNIQYDYFNRNTVFGLDSAFGSTQIFPTTYKSSVTSYTMSATASSSIKLGKFNISLDSLSSSIKYQWQSSEKKYKVESATIPAVTVSSSGTIFDLKGNDKKWVEYSDLNAADFSSELTRYREDKARTSGSDLDYSTDTDSKNRYQKAPTSMLSGPDVSSINKSVTGGNLSLTYSFKQTANNTFMEDFLPDDFNTKFSGNVTLSGKTPGKWFSFTDVMKPSLDYDRNIKTGAENPDTLSFNLVNSLTASVPFIGLTYNLSQKVYNLSDSNGTQVSRAGVWDSNDVTAHNLSISHTFGAFTLGFTENFKPLAEALKPSVSVSKNGFSASSYLNVKRDIGAEDFAMDKAVANFSYSKANRISATFNNTFDFSEKSWGGYKMYQDLYLYFFSSRLTIYDTMNMSDKFKLSDMEMGVKFLTKNNDTNSLSMSFKDENWQKDKLKVNLGYTIKPKYWWKNRMGVESTMSTNFTYDFTNKYGATLGFNFTLNFAVSKFSDLKFTVKSANNSFYKYYTNADGSFSFAAMFKDLLNSFDFFGKGRYSTAFNLNGLTMTFVHYMHDWNFYCDATAAVATNTKGKSEWVPEIKLYIKWNAIPDLKVENQYKSGTWSK